MLPLRHARRWQIASFVFLLLVMVAALVPVFWDWDNRISVYRMFARLDLWLHFVIFAALSVWFAGMYQRNRYWAVGAGLLLFGIIIEVCQRVVGYRTAELADIGADAAGIVIGLMIALLGAGGWCARVEQRLIKSEQSQDG